MTTPTRHSLPEAHADAEEPPDRRTGELTARELFRWGWRQLTSMRTALVLLLLLALAAIPGSVIPQSGVDSLKTSRWQADHPDLTPIYERLGLFSVYDSAWFAAIYTLLMVSLVGCIIPRLFVYWRALRAKPPVNRTRRFVPSTWPRQRGASVTLAVRRQRLNGHDAALRG